jgi:hypothetical protein
MIAHATHAVTRLRTPASWTVPTHAFDYCNAVNHWLRNFKNPHQTKAVYLAAWFVTDTIREVDSYPDDPAIARPDPASRRAWADGRSLAQVLAELLEAIILTAMKGWTSPVVAAGTETAVGGAGNTEAIGDVLYTTYLFPFEVASLILLVAMIGAVILAKKDLVEPAES